MSLPKNRRVVGLEGRRLTMASTGAAEAEFAWLLPVLGGGPVMPGVRRRKLL
jgi:hypothetical protein